MSLERFHHLKQWLRGEDVMKALFLVGTFCFMACSTSVSTSDAGTLDIDDARTLDIGDAGTLDQNVTPIPDATLMDLPDTCPSEYIFMEVRLPNGTILRECQSLGANGFYIETQNCLYWGTAVGSVGGSLTSLMGVLAVRGELPSLNRTGPTLMAASIGTNDQVCGFETYWCLRTPRSGRCCTFDTRVERTCQWNITRAANVGEVVEMELTAPCTLRSYLPVDGGTDNPPRGPDAVLLRGRIRGTVRVNEQSSQPTHSDVVVVMDCGSILPR
jgi:hypothetical protein